MRPISSGPAPAEVRSFPPAIASMLRQRPEPADQVAVDVEPDDQGRTQEAGEHDVASTPVLIRRTVPPRRPRP